MNFDFYSEQADRASILDFIFKETNWEIYDLSSENGGYIRKYKSIDEIETRIKVDKGTSHFQLYSSDFGGKVSMRKIALNPKQSNGHTFRYATEGLGLIQLYFGKMEDNKFEHSHIGHNSEKRAGSLSAANPNLNDASQWNWKEIESASAKLMNKIKRLADARHNGYYVLPAAKEAMKIG